MGNFDKKNIDWFAPFDRVQAGSFEKGDIGWFLNSKGDVAWFLNGKKSINCFAPLIFDRVQAWFLNGKLNVSYNWIDRRIKYIPTSIAIIWEENDSKHGIKITLQQLQEQVCKMANVLKKHTISKRDFVIIDMAMIPQAVYGL